LNIMRWVILILNLLAAGMIAFTAHFFHLSGHTRGSRLYRELVANHALVENPDVEAKLQGLAGGGDSYDLLGFLAAGVCIANGLVFFFSHRRNEKHKGISPGLDRQDER